MSCSGCVWWILGLCAFNEPASLTFISSTKYFHLTNYIYTVFNLPSYFLWQQNRKLKKKKNRWKKLGECARFNKMTYANSFDEEKKNLYVIWSNRLLVVRENFSTNHSTLWSRWRLDASDYFIIIYHHQKQCEFWITISDEFCFLFIIVQMNHNNHLACASVKCYSLLRYSQCW